MSLPDPQRSRVVLVGASSFTDPGLAELPAVCNNLTDLAACFRDPNLWGLPESHCVVVPDPKLPDDFLDPVHTAAAAAEDTLLVYYAGHGQLDHTTNELLLAVGGSKSGRSHTSVRYEYVQRDVRQARARRRVVILDCCYSGKAMGDGMANSTTTVADEASAMGTYLIASAPPNKQALSPPGETHTAFTGELIALLRNGLPGGDPLLDLDTIYRHVFYALRDKSRPEPQKRAGNTAGDLALARNVRWRSHQVQADWEETKVARDFDKHSGEETRSISAATLTLDKRTNPDGGTSSLALLKDGLLDNRYRIGRLISHGEHATVWIAHDLSLKRTVVVKVLMCDSDPEARDSMLRAARVAAALDHLGVVRIYNINESGSQPYIVMEHVDGQPLSEIITTQDWMTSRHAAEIVADACGALNYCHRLKAAHGALEPGNVMLTSDGTVKLINVGFGIGPAGDIYSIGPLLYTMIRGFPPPADGSLPSVQISGIPSKLNDIIAKAMQGDHGYADIAELRADLDRYLSKV